MIELQQRHAEQRREEKKREMAEQRADIVGMRQTQTGKSDRGRGDWHNAPSSRDTDRQRLKEALQLKLVYQEMEKKSQLQQRKERYDSDRRMTKELKEAAKLRKDEQQLKEKQQLKRRRSESKVGKKVRPDGTDVVVGPGRAADGLRLPPPVWMGPGLDRGPHTVSLLNVASVSIPQKARDDGRFEIEVKGCDGQHRMVVARDYDEFAAFKERLTYASSGQLKDVDVPFPPRLPGDKIGRASCRERV